MAMGLISFAYPLATPLLWLAYLAFAVIPDLLRSSSVRRLKDNVVNVADPGRAYIPKSGLAEIGRYTVPTSRDLEDRESRETVVYALTA